MRRLRAALRWVTDYRNGLTVVASVVVVLVGFTVVDASRTRDAALRAAKTEASAAESSQHAATARISALTDDITNLRTELDGVLAASNDEQRRQAVADAAARRPATATTTTVPFPPSTLTPATTVPANPPAPAAQAPPPAPAPSTTTTTAAPPPTTTPPTTAPCTSLPVVGCVTRASRGSARTDLDWAALRQCESSGDYSTNTGNGFYGAYQFDARTWHGLGFDGLPSDAAPDVQDDAARLLYSQRGPQPWPTCGKYL